MLNLELFYTTVYKTDYVTLRIKFYCIICIYLCSLTDDVTLRLNVLHYSDEVLSPKILMWTISCECKKVFDEQKRRRNSAELKMNITFKN